MKKIFSQEQRAFYKASFFCTIVLRDRDGQAVLLSDGDRLIFGVRSDFDSNYLIKKVLTNDTELNGGYPIAVSPEEMTMQPGRYYYDISVQTENGDFIKVVPPSRFTVYKSYTEKEGSGLNGH